MGARTTRPKLTAMNQFLLSCFVTPRPPVLKWFKRELQKYHYPYLTFRVIQFWIRKFFRNNSVLIQSLFMSHLALKFSDSDSDSDSESDSESDSDFFLTQTLNQTLNYSDSDSDSDCKSDCESDSGSDSDFSLN